MSFNGKNVQVTGRDRNDVLEEDIVVAVASLFRRCSNKDLLRTLLIPLQGKASGSVNSESWLLKGRSSHFLNRVLEIEKDYILHHILRVPQGALFVSRKTTESTEPFIKWAAPTRRARELPLQIECNDRTSELSALVKREKKAFEESLRRFQEKGAAMKAALEAAQKCAAQNVSALNGKHKVGHT